MHRDQYIFSDVFYLHEVLFFFTVLKSLYMVFVQRVSKGLGNADGLQKLINITRHRVTSRGLNIVK